MATINGISPSTLEVLKAMPGLGGTHRWLAQAAGGLRRALTADRCFSFLRACCDRFVTHRRVPDDEIWDAIDFAFGSTAHASHRPGTAQPQWPSINRRLIKEIVRTTPACVGRKPSGHRTAEVLRGLFRPGELLCMGPTKYAARVRPLEEAIVNAHRMQFIVVNPMKALQGLNKQGRPSPRCQSNVVERRYLVVEFDDPELTKPIQSHLATRLSVYAPLVLAVDSGNKSIHSWYRVDGLSPLEQNRFFALACFLGADPSRWDICGWVRMPGGRRHNATSPLVIQEVLYFNINGMNRRT
jgi:hypothetical protein